MLEAINRLIIILAWQMVKNALDPLLEELAKVRSIGSLPSQCNTLKDAYIPVSQSESRFKF